MFQGCVVPLSAGPGGLCYQSGLGAGDTSIQVLHFEITCFGDLLNQVFFWSWPSTNNFRLLELCFSVWWGFLSPLWPGRESVCHAFSQEILARCSKTDHSSFIYLLLQPSWCGHGWPWKYICKWDILSTGWHLLAPKASEWRMWSLPESFQWMEIFWRRNLHKCYSQVLIVSSSIRQISYFFQAGCCSNMVVLLVAWKWILLLPGDLLCLELWQQPPSPFQTPEGETQAVVSWDSLLLGYCLAMVLVLWKVSYNWLLNLHQVAIGLSQLLLHLTSTKLYIVKPLDLIATLIAFYAR